MTNYIQFHGTEGLGWKASRGFIPPIFSRHPEAHESATDYLFGNGFLESIESYLSQAKAHSQTQTPLYNQSLRFQASQRKMQTQTPIKSQLGFTRLNVEEMRR